MTLMMIMTMARTSFLILPSKKVLRPRGKYEVPIRVLSFWVLNEETPFSLEQAITIMILPRCLATENGAGGIWP